MEFVYEAEDAFPPEFCDFVIDKYEKSPHKSPGEVLKNINTGGKGRINDSIKKTIDIPTTIVFDDPEWREIISKVQETCLNHTQLYYEKIRDENVDLSSKDSEYILNCLMSRIFFKTITFPQVQKYEPGGYFKWHDDYSPNKMISFLIYLNTLEEGDGGGTDFFCGKKVRPKKGKIVIFPATWTYIHRGEDLIKNSKYIISMFGMSQ